MIQSVYPVMLIPWAFLSCGEDANAHELSFEWSHNALVTNVAGLGLKANDLNASKPSNFVSFIWMTDLNCECLYAKQAFSDMLTSAGELGSFRVNPSLLFLNKTCFKATTLQLSSVAILYFYHGSVHSEKTSAVIGCSRDWERLHRKLPGSWETQKKLLPIGGSWVKSYMNKWPALCLFTAPDTSGTQLWEVTGRQDDGHPLFKGLGQLFQRYPLWWERAQNHGVSLWVSYGGLSAQTKKLVEIDLKHNPV